MNAPPVWVAPTISITSQAIRDPAGIVTGPGIVQLVAVAGSKLQLFWLDCAFEAPFTLKTAMTVATLAGIAPMIAAVALVIVSATPGVTVATDARVPPIRAGFPFAPTNSSVSRAVVAGKLTVAASELTGTGTLASPVSAAVAALRADVAVVWAAAAAILPAVAPV